MTALGEIAERHGVMVFEDAAQAHGATWNGAAVGSFGTFAMFSLYPTKNMTSGEGGMVSCVDEDVARRVKLLRNQGTRLGSTTPRCSTPASRASWGHGRRRADGGGVQTLRVGRQACRESAQPSTEVRLADGSA